MSALSSERREVLVAQIHFDDKPASFVSLFSFHTPLELAMNAVGLVAAIASGE